MEAMFSTWQGPEALSCVAQRERVMLQAAQENRAAFASIYEVYVDRLYSYALHCCRDALLAEDVVAETFERALEHLQEFEWRGRPLSAWLYRIAGNVLAAHYRRQARDAYGWAVAAVPDSDPGPEQAVVHAERRQEVRAAVAALSLVQRQVIVLRYGHDLSIRKIARSLGLSEGAVKQHLYRAQHHLQRWIDASPQGDFGRPATRPGVGVGSAMPVTAGPPGRSSLTGQGAAPVIGRIA